MGQSLSKCEKACSQESKLGRAGDKREESLVETGSQLELGESGCVICQAELPVLWGLLTSCNALKLVKFSFFSPIMS